MKVSSVFLTAINGPIPKNLPMFKDNWDKSIFKAGIMKGISKPIEIV